MYTLKSIVKRGVTGMAGLMLVAATFLPAMTASADALNPLTNRSLTLSSSAPGWDYKDGSGNSTYAAPNSGANGQKTGNYFDFRVSSTETIEAMTFQYCTTSAGSCYGPGNNGYTGAAPSATRNADSATTSDLNITENGSTEISSIDFPNVIDTTSADGNIKANPQADIAQPIDPSGDVPNNAYAGSYAVYYWNGTAWAQSSDWDITVTKVQDGSVANELGTNGNNFITLTNSTGLSLTSGQRVKVVFFASDSKFYITNPGDKEFFVKINTYNDDATQDASTLVDGGVTVANMMNHSIRIQTKVLETMQFSVGTVDPNTLDSTDDLGGGVSTFNKATGKSTHGPCDIIEGGMDKADLANVNVLRMGNQAAEDSLETGHTYSTHSFWRLSSNSSAGATVYYAGVTLSNTVGDKIDAIYRSSADDGLSAAPQIGREQFGLALTTDGAGDYTTNYDTETTSGKIYENGADGSPAGVHASADDRAGNGEAQSNASWHMPKLAPLLPKANYTSGAGVVNSDYGTIDTAFAFDPNSNTIPVALAQENNEVVDCVTGRMRYIANIAATTPAGIYTTAINYIAAPQY